MTTSYTINTAMGQIRPGDLPFLTDEETKEFNVIGYTGHNSQGIKSSYSEYLNSLGKGEFSVKCTKFDSGDFQETFEVSRHVDTGMSLFAMNLMQKCNELKSDPNDIPKWVVDAAEDYCKKVESERDEFKRMLETVLPTLNPQYPMYHRIKMLLEK